MSEQEIVEFDGTEYVKLPDEEDSCGDCVFYDNQNGACGAPNNPAFWGFNEKFIWKKKEG